MKQKELNKYGIGFYSVFFKNGNKVMAPVVKYIESERKNVINMDSSNPFEVEFIEKITLCRIDLLEKSGALSTENKCLLAEHKTLSEDIEKLKKENYLMVGEAYVMQNEINRLKNNEKTRDFINSTGCKWNSFQKDLELEIEKRKSNPP